MVLSGMVYSQNNHDSIQDPFAIFPTNTLSTMVGKYGADTVMCENNLTIYNEFYKQKSYDSAYLISTVRFELAYSHSSK